MQVLTLYNRQVRHSFSRVRNESDKK